MRCDTRQELMIKFVSCVSWNYPGTINSLSSFLLSSLSFLSQSHSLIVSATAIGYIIALHIPVSLLPIYSHKTEQSCIKFPHCSWVEDNKESVSSGEAFFLSFPRSLPCLLLLLLLLVRNLRIM